jgi:predicted nucleic-acid-binding Zn-ribbon protein
MNGCPACGLDYSAHTVVKSGDTFSDHLPAPPYTFFKKYARMCVDPETYQRAAGATHTSLDLYFHTLSDLQGDQQPLPIQSSSGNGP